MGKEERQRLRAEKSAARRLRGRSVAKIAGAGPEVISGPDGESVRRSRLRTESGVEFVGRHARVLLTVREDCRAARQQFKAFCRATGTSAILCHGYGESGRPLLKDGRQVYKDGQPIMVPCPVEEGGHYHTATYDVAGMPESLNNLLGRWFVVGAEFVTTARVGWQGSGQCAPHKPETYSARMERAYQSERPRMETWQAEHGVGPDRGQYAGPEKVGGAKGNANPVPPKGDYDTTLTAGTHPTMGPDVFGPPYPYARPAPHRAAGHPIGACPCKPCPACSAL